MSDEKAEALAAFEARQNERHSGTVSLKTEWLKAWEAGRESLRAELENERERILKLFKFTSHRENCAGIQGFNEDYGVPCTCGLTEILDDYEAKP